MFSYHFIILVIIYMNFVNNTCLIRYQLKNAYHLENVYKKA